MALTQYISDLHGQCDALSRRRREGCPSSSRENCRCDFLIQNFDKRKEARTNEIEAIKKAKAVLASADFSFVQVGEKKHVEKHTSQNFLHKSPPATCEGDEQRRFVFAQQLAKLVRNMNDACETMCRKMGQYPDCPNCKDMPEPDLTPGHTTWDELYAIFDQLKDSGRQMLKKYH